MTVSSIGHGPHGSNTQPPNLIIVGIREVFT
ncbi:hypothetical protein COLO4_18329 [Corchorus olitorius]|uniref:Uncharacterized protein n=1 Tax=Corchorus olitorius TaxID=93759 RepID=A0A1R3J9H6_9ROSI|nr:hypothetical protein COLO4_18329 [Corchorus olitorius]